MDTLRRMVAEEDFLASTAPTLDERRAHAERALRYRADMRTLQREQMARFAGLS
jgi:hypothetical protein